MRIAEGSPSAVAVDYLIAELDTTLRELSANPGLLDEVRYSERAAALDRLEFEIIDRLRAQHTAILAPTDGGSGEEPVEPIRKALERAEALRHSFERVDHTLFEKLRGDIRSGLRGEALRSVLSRYVSVPTVGLRRGYDELDDFLAGLLLPPPVPEASLPLEEGMVFYQPTPARVALEMCERIGPATGQCFIDIGSGLGLVPMLVHLLIGARTVGIEIDPAYRSYAAARALDLGISDHVEFLEEDARFADYAKADIVFLYTPFLGVMLDEVLDRLRDHCLPNVRIFSYGPCTPTLDSQAWLEPVGPAGSPELLAMFKLSPSSSHLKTG